MTNDQFQCLTILTANYPPDTPTTTPLPQAKTIWLKIPRVVFSVEEITFVDLHYDQMTFGIKAS